MTSVIVNAYAKINLTLDVFNKRADGYHSLASVVQTVSLHDTITLAPNSSDDIQITCDGEHSANIPADASNLAVRAARALLDVAGITGGLTIRLNKRVPAQAGLGGGSSDAAAVLLGTAELFGLDVGPKLFHTLAASLGSDVPFFLTGGTAVIRGRGENIKPIVDIPPMWLTIVKPVQNVSTGWAYDALDSFQNRSSNRATGQFEEAIKTGDTGRIVSGQSNDFEAAVFREFPSISWLRDELLMAGAVAAHLCGSGSAVYGVAVNENQAKRTTELLRKSYPQTYLIRTLSRIEANPLRDSIFSPELGGSGAQTPAVESNPRREWTQ